MRKFAMALLGVLSITGCSGDSMVAPTPVASNPAPTVTAAPVALYRITFDSTWSAQSHPTDIPRNPHFSRLIGGTHRSAVKFWEDGGMATEGIRLMAEQGRTIPLDQEIEAAIAAGNAKQLLVGGSIDRSPDRTSLDFEIYRDFPLVTLVSMLAPSPDWFVGVNSLSLIENGDWVSEKVIPLGVWDAGTDSGATYGAPDQRTVPQDRIHLIRSGPLVVGSAVPPVGTFTFRRLN